MYATRKWEKSAQSRRFKAFLITAAFHLVLFAGIVYSIDSDFKDLLPEFLQEILFEEASKNPKVTPPKA